ncbi:MAG: PASTA domain-containing protein [Clostridia bacterium]|nr:PASTA domain-containing protein [Clostridia bacterium]
METNKSKNNIKYKASRPKRFFALELIIFIVFFILLIKIAYLQFIQGSYLKELATKQQTTSRILSAKRGAIYDSTGTALAISADVDTVTINPQKFVKNTNNETKELQEKIATKLSEIFELDYQETLTKVCSNNSVETIVQKVEKDKISELQKWMEENKISAGINIDEDTKRYYPYSNLASNLIGFCGNDNQGLTGLEYHWDTTLAGTAGKITTTQDASQDLISNQDAQYYAAENGSNLTLTIDINIQTIAEKYLEQACATNKCVDGGNIIIMDPNTGDILAMATYPDYNLNLPFEPNESLSESWDSLSPSAQSEALQKMWRNTAVSNTYEPGSVFKVVVASAALEENIVDTDTSAVFRCSGFQEIADRKIGCANTAGHGYQSLRQALQNSCNPAFIQLGQKIGVDTLYKYFEAFGFFKKTSIATSGEAFGIFHNKSSVGPVELATISFGQRFTITPLQMISAVSAIANDGYLMQPRIVKEVTNADTGAITTVETKKVRQVISAETSKKMLSMMESVVTDGGGKYGQVAGYSVAGKTGTSEAIEGSTAGYVPSFVAVAPSDDPQLVVLLTLYNPQGKDHFGGHIAAPVVSQVLSEVLPYLGIPSKNSSTDTPVNQTISKEKKITLHGVTNKTASEAKKLLEEQGFKCSFSCEQDAIITEQIPKQGTPLVEGSIIKLYSSETSSDKTKTTVPDLKGLSYTAAKNTLSSKNLNINVVGSGKVVSQDPIAGTETTEGSVITVTLQEDIGSSSH